MDLDAHEAARLLFLTSDEVHRLAREGTLPSCRVHDQYRFNRVEILEWARTRDHRIAPDICAPGGPTGRLSAALERGSVHHRVPGSTTREVLGAVTRLPTIPPSVDRGLLLQLLLSREAMASTGIGGGIALPHPRDPLVFPADGPIVLCCFLEHPVDFGAVDGQPVRTVFTLLSPSIQLHLATLGWLTYTLHDPTMCALLDRRAPGEAILGHVRRLENERAAPRGTP